MKKAVKWFLIFAVPGGVVAALAWWWWHRKQAQTQIGAFQAIDAKLNQGFNSPDFIA